MKKLFCKDKISRLIAGPVEEPFAVFEDELKRDRVPAALHASRCGVEIFFVVALDLNDQSGRAARLNYFHRFVIENGLRGLVRYHGVMVCVFVKHNLIRRFIGDLAYDAGVRIRDRDNTQFDFQRGDPPNRLDGVRLSRMPVLWCADAILYGLTAVDDRLGRYVALFRDPTVRPTRAFARGREVIGCAEAKRNTKQRPARLSPREIA